MISFTLVRFSWVWIGIWVFASTPGCISDDQPDVDDGEIVRFADSQLFSPVQISEVLPDSTHVENEEEEEGIQHNQYAWIVSSSKQIEVPYQIRGGYAVIDGDVLIGDESQFHSRARSVVRVYRPWACSTVFYRFSSEIELLVSGKNRKTVAHAIQHFENQTGLKFVYLHEPQPTDNYIEVRQWHQSWGNSYVGMRGGNQDLNLPEDASLRLVIHEFGHAVGLSHEHQHPHRDQFVFFDDSCVRPGREGNFRLQTEVEFSDSYDYASVMHYKSSGFCMHDIADRDKDGKLDECGYRSKHKQADKCYPLLRIAGDCPESSCEDRDGDGFREYILGGERLSSGDIRAISRLYKEQITHKKGKQAEVYGDGFGSSIVVGDFDGDEVSDFAVGAPRLPEELESGVSGRVFVYRGYSAGFMECQILAPQDFARDGPKTSIRPDRKFGSSLATADFDNDGVDDLAIGGQGNEIELEASSRSENASSQGGEFGSVYVYRSRNIKAGADSDAKKKGPAKRAFRPWKLLTAQLWGGEQNGSDQFGLALATGDLDGDEWYDDLAIGAPSMIGESQVSAGAVMIAYGDQHGLAVGEQLGQQWEASHSFMDSAVGPLSLSSAIGQDSTGDEFGKSMVIGDIDGDSVDELFVGAPCDRIRSFDCAGAVYVFAREDYSIKAMLRIDQQGLARVEAHDRFGESLALLDLNRDGQQELIVGSPGEDIERSPDRVDLDAGYVFVVRVSRHGYRSEPDVVIPWWNKVGPGSRLGASIAALELDSSAHSPWRLWIGAVSRDSKPKHSSLYGLRFRSPMPSNSPKSGIIEALNSMNESAAFASALALATHYGRDYLAVGAPWHRERNDRNRDKAINGDGPGRGRVFLYRIDQQEIVLAGQLGADE